LDSAFHDPLLHDSALTSTFGQSETNSDPYSSFGVTEQMGMSAAMPFPPVESQFSLQSQEYDSHVGSSHYQSQMQQQSPPQQQYQPPSHDVAPIPEASAGSLVLAFHAPM